ncbi:MAG: hypothetical protein H8E35_02100 [Ardenticatenia bacterium]|nr:hypothetical protein [Ardenticatenia bacterium]
MRKESWINPLIGCFSIIGVIFTILGFIVAVLTIFYPQPIYIFLEAIFPTLTAPASVVLKPTPVITLSLTPTQVPATPTPITANEQNPPPGTTVPAGQPISKGGISIILRKSIKTSGYCTPNFGLSFTIKNSSREQKFISYKPSFFRGTDDLGNQYFPAVCAGYGQKEEHLDNIKQFPIEPGESLVLKADISSWHSPMIPLYIPFFQGSIPPDAKFIIITIDKFAGMENLMWRYDLH